MFRKLTVLPQSILTDLFFTTSGIKAFFFRLIIDVKCEMSITEMALTNHPQDDVHKLAGKKS